MCEYRFKYIAKVQLVVHRWIDFYDRVSQGSGDDGCVVQTTSKEYRILKNYELEEQASSPLPCLLGDRSNTQNSERRLIISSIPIQSNVVSDKCVLNGDRTILLPVADARTMESSIGKILLPSHGD